MHENGSRPSHDYDLPDYYKQYLINRKVQGQHDQLAGDITLIATGETFKASVLHGTWMIDFLAQVYYESPEVIEGTLRQEFSRHGLRDQWSDLFKKIKAHVWIPIETVPLSSIPREDVSWLWSPYIPMNKITLMEGDPGAGKTFLLLAICAAVTQGWHLPDQFGKVPAPDPDLAGNVIYITAEDAPGDTLRPRAEDLGANLDRLYVVPNVETFDLSSIPRIAAMVTERQARLLVIDPLTAFLGAEMDMHRTNEVRPFMTLLSTIAQQAQCAIVAVRHWTKATGGKARHRGQGNMDFFAAARSVLSIGESPEDEKLRIMAQAKNSLGAYGRSLVFEIKENSLFWAGTSELTADELSQLQPHKYKHQRQDAVIWLTECLSDGPKPAKLVIQMAEATGISQRTLERAKASLKILSVYIEGQWCWKLRRYDPWDIPDDRNADDLGTEI